MASTKLSYSIVMAELYHDKIPQMKQTKIHILGICGTFMGGLAVLARSLGYQVSGSDKNVYPPMSTQLESLGIQMHQGYDNSIDCIDSDEYIVGNVMTRGMPVVESLLQSSQYFTSGPQWLGDNLLRNKKVFAVSGTHGKTTTTSMIAWVLQDNGRNPGFLIGGVPAGFEISARNTESKCFVIEADEYDSAFFDKRSKFVHYHADVAVLNNLEYDHADIFDNLDAIKTQFHHFVRTIPGNGKIILNNDDKNLKDVLKKGCWTPIITFGENDSADIWAKPIATDYSCFDVYFNNDKQTTLSWNLTGKHNMLNALAAIAAALEEQIAITDAVNSLQKFKGIKRRMELIGQSQGITIFDDFAHHPTAIATTIDGVKNNKKCQRLVVVFEPRSNSMRAGAHAEQLPGSLKQADIAFVMTYPQLKWQPGIKEKLTESGVNTVNSVDELLEQLQSVCESGDTVMFMSNGGFENAPRRFYQLLEENI